MLLVDALAPLPRSRAHRHRLAGRVRLPKPENTLLIAALSLAARITRERGFTTYVPQMGETLALA